MPGKGTRSVSELNRKSNKNLFFGDTTIGTVDHVSSCVGRNNGLLGNHINCPLLSNVLLLENFLKKLNFEKASYLSSQKSICTKVSLGVRLTGMSGNITTTLDTTNSSAESA